LRVITGLEATTEDPMNKNKASSYLVGYRYGLAGVAKLVGNDIGTTATTSYQNLSFKLNRVLLNWANFQCLESWLLAP